MPEYQYLIFTKAVNKISRKFLQYLENLEQGEGLSRGLLGILGKLSRNFVVMLLNFIKPLNWPLMSKSRQEISRKGLLLDSGLIINSYPNVMDLGHAHPTENTPGQWDLVFS